MEKNLSCEKAAIFQVFDAISSKYDRINTLLSLNMDAYWRHFLSEKIQAHYGNQPLSLLDLATGTGSQIAAILKKNVLKKAVGLDVSTGMLEIARKKIPNAHFVHGSALEIPFSENSFDAISMSFGIRNVTDTNKCLSEIYRVLQNKGACYILEFSLPTNTLFKKLYLTYLRHILPKIGKLLSKHALAYTYLNQTIEAFPYGDEFLKLLKDAGFNKVFAYPLHFGIVTLYIGQK